ncbi:MAG: DUF2271 domain-containing protein [Polyangia bacterium]
MVSTKRRLLLCALLTSACGSPPEQKEFWRPWYELIDGSVNEPPIDLSTPSVPPDAAAGRPDGAAPSDGSAGPSDLGDLGTMPRPCSLSVTVTTTSAGGRYSPRNIGAIWVSDASDRFIKTLAVWADKRARYLKRWNDATAAAGTPASRVDAISSATKSSHGVRTGTWSCTNTAAMPVPDGDYKVCFELTDYDGQGPYSCVGFTKGPAPFTLTPPDAPSFTARRLELVP